jgi:hypothetical protein
MDTIPSMDLAIWLSIARRLTVHIHVDEINIPYREPKSLNGIISYLMIKHGGNVHDKEIVTITSSSVIDDSRYEVRNLGDFGDLGFGSEDQLDPWVRWDFNDLRIKPSHYTVQSSYPRSWMVEGSNDGIEWVVMHREPDTDVLNSEVIASFRLETTMECRYVRFTQIGKNHRGTLRLLLHAFEVFGVLLQ